MVVSHATRTLPHHRMGCLNPSLEPDCGTSAKHVFRLGSKREADLDRPSRSMLLMKNTTLTRVTAEHMGERAGIQPLQAAKFYT
jgi:hypothetical protein